MTKRTPKTAPETTQFCTPSAHDCPLCGQLCGGGSFVARDGSVREYCVDCRRLSINELSSRVRANLLRDFGGSCRLCGYSKYSGSLHFYHFDSSHKSEWSTRGNKTNPEEIKSHPERFILVCANCHGEIHAGFYDHFEGRYLLHMSTGL